MPSDANLLHRLPVVAGISFGSTVGLTFGLLMSMFRV